MKTTVLLVLCLASACAKELPPAATPDRIVPTVATSASPAMEGTGRLVIDVVDGPTPVHRVMMDAQPVNDGNGQTTWRYSESHALLCNASPCVVDLAPGNIALAFPVLGDSGESEVELVHISTDPSVYRRSLSYQQGGHGAYVLGIVGTAIGGMSMTTGAVFLPLGLAKDNAGFTTAGAITLGVGSAIVALSILGIVADAPEHRAGASIHYPLTPPPAD